MKQKSFILGVVAVLFVIVLNINDALEGYVLLGNDLASQVLAQNQTHTYGIEACDPREYIRNAAEGFDYVTTENGYYAGVTTLIPDTPISVAISASASGEQTYKVHICPNSPKNCCGKSWLREAFHWDLKINCLISSIFI